MIVKYSVFRGGWIVALLMLMVPVHSSVAEVISGNAIHFDISRDGLQNKMERLEAKQGIDKESKEKELAWYQKAYANIGNQKWYEFQYLEYQNILKTTPEKLKGNNKYKLGGYQASKQLTEKESQILIVTLKGELRIVEDEISKLEYNFNKYLNRPQQISEEIQKAKKRLARAKKESKIIRKETENKYEYEAYQVYLYTLSNSLLAELNKLELEITTNPLRIQLNKYVKEPLLIQQNEIINVISEQKKWVDIKQLENEKTIQEELLIIERDSINKNSVIQEIIQRNIQLRRDLQATIHSINDYESKIEEIISYKKEVAVNYKHAEKKIKLAGLSPILGRVLREQRRSLEKNKQRYEHSKDINDETGLISLAQYRVENRLKLLGDRHTEFDQYMKKILPETGKEELNSEDVRQIRDELNLLLSEQKHVLDKLTHIYLKKLRALGGYEYSRQQLLTQINQYEVYLDKRLLWVPSSSVINLKYPLAVYHSVVWLSSPERWLKLANYLLITFKAELFISTFLTLFLVLLLYIRPYIKNKVSIIQETVGKPYSDKISYTFQMLIFNLILILPVPLILLYISWLLRLSSFEDRFNYSIGEGTYYAAIVICILQFFIVFLEDQGIAELHFRWQKKTICLVRRQLKWMRFSLVPCVFIIYMTSAINVADHSDSLGRLALIVFMSILFVFAMRLFRPGKGILNTYFTNNTELWWGRFPYLWLFLFTSIPVVIVGFSVMGYYISAIELQQKTIMTLRMIFFCIVAYYIVIRWLGLTKRELALKNARKKKQVHKLNAQVIDKPNSEKILVSDKELFDISTINQQTEKIVNLLVSTVFFVGFWLIWQNILPAFSFIDNIVLWKHIAIINGEEAIQAITLINLLFAALYVFLISIAVINFPGAMEMLIFRNLEIEAGSRYAINQLAKYTLVTIGFISVANELGGSWGQVQWLVAALTVGLGFGLQEIFANMVSGIILLFERPIRVGDTVTVDNISGRVTRIQMRATTIMDWDQKELIVPNKAFITNQLINWTLSDPLTRLVIPLGISYGSDIDLAYKTIKEAVCSTPFVLRDPEPSVFFIGFGDSSLDFSIRVYINDLNIRWSVKHDLHVRVLKALRKQNIEIPFPQRDLHIHSISNEFPGAAS